MRPIPRTQVGSGRRGGRVRYNCLKEAGLAGGCRTCHNFRNPQVRAIVERESNWQPCVISPKGAVGLMQLMPATAKRLGVTDRCNLDHNVSGGVRYLAWLMRRFHNDLRLVAAAYYVGEDTIGRRGLAYRNLDVVTYVRAIRTTYLREAGSESESKNTSAKRDVR